MWKKVVHSIYAEIFIVIFSLINTIFINRGLGPSGKGEYSYILLVASTFAMVLELGVSTGISFFTGKRISKDPDEWKTFSVLISSVWLFLTILFCSYIFVFLKNRSNLVIIAVIFLFQLTQRYFLGNVLGQSNIKFYNVIRALPIFFETIGLFIVFLLGMAFTPNTAAIIFILSMSIPLMLNIIRIFPFKWKIPSFKSLLSMWRYSILIYLANLMSFLNYRLDMFLITYFLPIEYLGWYSVAVFIIEKSRILSQSSSTVNFSIKINDTRAVSFGRNMRIINSINAVFILFIAVFSYPFIVLMYSKSYTPAVFPLLILAPAIFANGMGKMMSSEFSGDNIIKYQLFASFASISVNFLLNLILIPVLKINGASLSSLISYSLNAGIISYYFCKHYSLDFKEILFMNKDDFLIFKTRLISFISANKI